MTENEGEPIPGLSFLEKLRAAVARDLDYWVRPTNLSQAAFKAVLDSVEGENSIVFLKWSKRQSTAGNHGHDGEDRVFMCKLKVSQLGVEKRFYLKGYFFTRTVRRGVTIQSFKRDDSV